MAHYNVYASYYREGILFIHLPRHAESDSLLGLLERRDEVIRNLLKKHLPVLTDVAVLVADLQGSVRICTELPPEEYFDWMERSIESLGYERDFYVHNDCGRPVSVETDINRTIETPISQSDTWAKIASGRADALDRSDRRILYALMRHLEARTPHARATAVELSEMAADPKSNMRFTDEERNMYAILRTNPEYKALLFNTMATDRFDDRDFDSAFISVTRSPFRLRTSTTPTITVSTPRHGAISLPLPDMVPFGRVLTVNPFTLVTIVDGDLGGYFSNSIMDEETAAGVNRNFAGYFASFPNVRHLVTDRNRLIEDMTWARYEVISDTPAKIVFRKTD